MSNLRTQDSVTKANPRRALSTFVDIIKYIRHYIQDCHVQKVTVHAGVLLSEVTALSSPWSHDVVLGERVLHFVVRMLISGPVCHRISLFMFGTIKDTPNIIRTRCTCKFPMVMHFVLILHRRCNFYVFSYDKTSLKFCASFRFFLAVFINICYLNYVRRGITIWYIIDRYYPKIIRKYRLSRRRRCAFMCFSLKALLIKHLALFKFNPSDTWKRKWENFVRYVHKRAIDLKCDLKTSSYRSDVSKWHAWSLRLQVIIFL